MTKTIIENIAGSFFIKKCLILADIADITWSRDTSCRGTRSLRLR